MTIAQQPRSMTFSATNEGIDLTARPITIIGMTMQGVGLTAGQRITMRDTATPGTGSFVIDYVTEAAIDNADLWISRDPLVVSGLAIDSATVAGTWALTVFYR